MEPPVDPLGSLQWSTMYRRFFEGQRVVFDEGVELLLPAEAEDSMNVPVAVRFDALGGADEVFVFVDYNPIPKVLHYYLGPSAAPFIGFGLKLQQGSPVRAAVRASDGSWHVGGRYVDAIGGGCTLPSDTRSQIDFDEIGRVHGRVWTRDDGSQRLRFRISHPMDTGLVAGIPAFFVEELTLEDEQGTQIARLETFEPVCENPIFSIEVKAERPSERFRLGGHDNNGLLIEATLE